MTSVGGCHSETWKHAHATVYQAQQDKTHDGAFPIVVKEKFSPCCSSDKVGGWVSPALVEIAEKALILRSGRIVFGGLRPAVVVVATP